jgi:NADPH:quinone reductase-like Zn-dependent oxidoreductase
VRRTVRGPHEGRDERDREIGHFGEHVGRSTIVAGGVAGLVLALAKAGYFWIANVLCLGFVLSAVLGSTARGADLETLADHLADGTPRPATDRTFPPAETPAAIRYAATGTPAGKVVVIVTQG